jgi:hypothetical protein
MHVLLQRAPGIALKLERHPMIFNVHTNQGVFKFDAPNPETARQKVKKECPDVFIGKVKLAAGQPKPSKGQPKPSKEKP